MNVFRKIASFLRWRLVPVRYVTMLLDNNPTKWLRSGSAKSSICETIETEGFFVPEPVAPEKIDEIITIYKPRAVDVVPTTHGHPFKNLFEEKDITVDNPVMQLAFSKKVLDVAADYFGNKVVLDSLQVLYSFSTEGELRESQYWHLDYGDQKSFHAIAYANDVDNDNDGPFGFVNKSDSKKIGRSFLVQRYTDEQISAKLGHYEIEKFTGKAGALVYVDPAACYHYGSRCKESRLAVFMTFNSWTPFARPAGLIRENKEKILKVAKEIRPDVSEGFLRSLLQMS